MFEVKTELPAAKLLACNERSRARVAEIAHLANECLLNTNHPTGYEPGQYGKDYLTYGKAMGEIRKLVKESIAEGEVGEVKVEGEGEQRNLPSIEEQDKDAKHEKYHRRHWTFCDGLFPISFVVTQEGFMERCTINGRRFKASVTQEDQADGTTWNGYIYDNGKCVCMVGGMGKGKVCVKEMTHAAFKAYVRYLPGNGGGKYHNKGGFLKLNAKRALAARRELENGGRA